MAAAPGMPAGMPTGHPARDARHRPAVRASTTRPSSPPAAARRSAPRPGRRPGRVDSQKAVAVQMMTEGRKLADAGQLRRRPGEVRGGRQGRGRVRPERVQPRLRPAGAEHPRGRRGGADGRTRPTPGWRPKDYAKADAALTGAPDSRRRPGPVPAAGRPRPGSQLRAASSGKFGGAAPAGWRRRRRRDARPGRPRAVPAAPGTASVGGEPRGRRPGT